MFVRASSLLLACLLASCATAIDEGANDPGKPATDAGRSDTRTIETARDDEDTSTTDSHATPIDSGDDSGNDDTFDDTPDATPTPIDSTSPAPDTTIDVVATSCPAWSTSCLPEGMLCSGSGYCTGYGSDCCWKCVCELGRIKCGSHPPPCP